MPNAQKQNQILSKKVERQFAMEKRHIFSQKTCNTIVQKKDLQHSINNIFFTIIDFCTSTSLGRGLCLYCF